MRLLISAIILVLVSWPTLANSDEASSRRPAALRAQVADNASGKSEQSAPLSVPADAEVQATPPAEESPQKTEPTLEAERAVSPEELCDAVAAAAHANELPVGFFARLIWRESRFVASAVSRAGAQGVAQFMPRVAAELGLTDPFDPLQALPKSAQFLGMLRRQFGNIGLAAAAYNAGSRRIKEWMEKRTKAPKQIRDRVKLPKETQNYVINITGHAPERWIDGAPGKVEFTLPQKAPCRNVIEAEQQAVDAEDTPAPVKMADASGSVKIADASGSVRLPLERPRQAVQRIHGVQVRQRMAQTKARSAPQETQVRPAAHPAAKGSPQLNAKASPQPAKTWGVQVALTRLSESKALQEFKELRQKHRAILSKRTPTIVRTKLAGKGAVVNRVQIAMNTRASAEQLCSKLKGAGGSCVVLQN